MHLVGSSAIVVGGAGGLGAATVRRLVAAGATAPVAGPAGPAPNTVTRIAPPPQSRRATLASDEG